jgi:hypothetical protein
MRVKLLKVDLSYDDPAEQEFDLAHYASLSTAERFRMAIERSILLLRLARRNAEDKESPSVAKRV